MRLPCNLRELRGSRSLREVAAQAGVAAAELSRIENGYAVPRDKDLMRLEAAYGHPLTDWYHPEALIALQLERDPRLVTTTTLQIA